jgi:hypothetical protein
LRCGLDSRAVDTFAIVVVGALVALIVWVWLLGKYYPGSNDFNEQRRRRESYLADRDLDELLETTNARRRARGLPERTREDVQREFGTGATPRS